MEHAIAKSLTQALEQIKVNYVKRTPKCKNAFHQVAQFIPGGNTRAALYFSPYPLVIASATGGKLIDADGHSYKDFINDFGAGLYGHSHPILQKAIIDAVHHGLNIGGITKHEGEFAQLLVGRFPALEKIRFTNSGTEANLMALATARIVTGREKILVMRGGYYGGVLSMAPTSVRTNAPYDFLYGSFNDLTKTEQAYAESDGDLAAIIVEPMMGAGGCIPADKEFLQGLNDMALRTGAILIFDEVITSRFGAAGAQGQYGITPDMMTCGKYLGGGGSFGAFGGRSDLMDIYNTSNTGHAVHNGTFNNNVITMVAGAAGLRNVYTPQVAADFFEVGNSFRQSLSTIAEEKGVALQITGMGPLMAFHFQNRPITSPEDVSPSEQYTAALFHLAMLERGIYLANRSMVSLSIVQSDDDFTAFKAAFSDVLDTYGLVFNESAQA